MEFLHNQKGVTCTILNNRFIFAKLSGIPILIQLYQDRNSDLPPSNASRLSCHIISYTENCSDVNHISKFLNPGFVWINGKPIHFADVEDGTHLNFDAIFSREFGYYAILVWQGFKPHHVPILKSDEFILSHSYFKVPIDEVSFKDGKAYVHVKIDEEIKKIPFSYNNVLINGDKATTESEAHNFLYTSRSLLASVCLLLPCISNDRQAHNIYHCFCISCDYAISDSETTFQTGNIYVLKDKDVTLSEFHPRPMIFHDVRFKQKQQKDHMELTFKVYGKNYLFKISCHCCKISKVEEGVGHIYVCGNACFILVTKIICNGKNLLADVADNKCPHCLKPTEINKLRVERREELGYDNDQNFEGKLDCYFADQKKHHLTNEIVACTEHLETMNSYKDQDYGLNEHLSPVISLSLKKKTYKAGNKESSISHNPHSNTPNIIESKLNQNTNFCENILSERYEFIDRHYLNSVCQGEKDIPYLLSDNLALLSQNVHGNTVLVFKSPKDESLHYRVISSSNFIFCEDQWLKLEKVNFPCSVYFDGVYFPAVNDFFPLLLWVDKRPFYHKFDGNMCYFGLIGIVIHSFPNLVPVIKVKIKGSFKDIKLSGEFGNQVFDTEGSPCKELSNGMFLRLKIEWKPELSEWKIVYAVVLNTNPDFEDYKNVIEELKQHTQTPGHQEPLLNQDDIKNTNDKMIKITEGLIKSKSRISSLNVEDLTGTFTPVHFQKSTENSLFYNNEQVGSVTITDTKVAYKEDMRDTSANDKVKIEDKINIKGTIIADNKLGTGINALKTGTKLDIKNTKTDDNFFYIDVKADKKLDIIDTKTDSNITIKITNADDNFDNKDLKTENIIDMKDLKTEPYKPPTSENKKISNEINKFANEFFEYFNCYLAKKFQKCFILTTKYYSLIIKKENIFFYPNDKKVCPLRLKDDTDIRTYAIRLVNPVKCGGFLITHYGVVAWQGHLEKIEAVTNIVLSAIPTPSELEQSITLLLSSDQKLNKYIKDWSNAVTINISKSISKKGTEKQKQTLKDIPEKHALPLTNTITVAASATKTKKKIKKNNINFKGNSLPLQQKAVLDNSITDMSTETRVYHNKVQIPHSEDCKNIENVNNHLFEVDDAQIPLFLWYLNKDPVKISGGVINKYNTVSAAILETISRKSTLYWANVYPSRDQVFLNITFDTSYQNLLPPNSLQDSSCIYPPIHLLLTHLDSEPNKIVTGTITATCFPSPITPFVPTLSYSKFSQRPGLFYYVEGKITFFNGNMGILTVNSDSINVTRPSSSLFCFFDEKAIFLINEKEEKIPNKIIYKLLKTGVCFKAAIYHCKREIFSNMEINFCVSLLWHKKFPEYVSFKHTLPPLHADFYSEVAHIFTRNVNTVRHSKNVNSEKVLVTGFEETNCKNMSDSYSTFEHSTNFVESYCLTLLESKGKPGMFYFVEGKITHFCGNEGILSVPSHYINVTKAGEPLVKCYFNKTVVQLLNKKGEVSEYISYISVHAIKESVFKAVIYQCQKIVMMSTDVEFCVSFLWRKKDPNMFPLKCILPPVHMDIYTKITQFFPLCFNFFRNLKGLDRYCQGLLPANISQTKTAEVMTISTPAVQYKADLAMSSLTATSLCDKIIKQCKTRMFYFVEGRVTYFNGDEGLFTFPSSYLSINETTTESAPVFCFFHRTVVYSQNKNGSQVKDVEDFIQQVKFHISFKAIVYQCQKQLFVGTEINFCVLILWKTTMPEDVTVTHILPPLNSDLFTKPIELSPNVKSQQILLNLGVVTKSQFNLKEIIATNNFFDLNKSEKLRKLKVSKLEENSQGRPSTQVNCNNVHIDYSQEPSIPVSKKVPGDERGLCGLVIEVDNNCGKLITTNQKLLEFSPKNCFLYGISLFNFSLKNILKIGTAVKYETDSSGAIEEVWIGGGPQSTAKETYYKILDWCKKCAIQSDVFLELLRECDWISPSCEPIIDTDPQNAIVTLT